MNVSPYLLLKRSVVDRMAAQALAALGAWGAAWAALPDHAVACADVADSAYVPAARPDDAWTARDLGAGARLYVLAPRDAQRWMESLVFGAEHDTAAVSALAGDVATQALDALVACLAEALTGQANLSATPHASAQPLPTHLLRRGAGSLLCTVQLGAGTLRVLVPAVALDLPAGGAASATSAAAPLATLRDALAAQPVALHVELARAELTLGYLRTLAVGDVLALPMRLDEPLQVHGPGGPLPCAAHLGTADGRRAIELTRPADGAPSTTRITR